MREFTVEELFKNVDEKNSMETLSTGRMLDLKRLQREDEEILRNTDYIQIAKTLIETYGNSLETFKAADINKLLNVTKLDPFYTNKIKQELNNQGYTFSKPGFGIYVIVPLKQSIEKKPVEAIETKKKQVKPKSAPAEVKKVEVIEKTKAAEVNQEPEEHSDCNCNCVEMKEGVVVHRELELLKDKIKNPEALINMNNFFKSSDIPLEFVIREVELIEIVKQTPVVALNPINTVVNNNLTTNAKRFSESLIEQSFNLDRNHNLISAKACPRCNNIVYSKDRPGEKNKCFKCNEEFDTKKQIFTHYKCPGCGKEMDITTDFDLNLVNCVDCRAPIDLVMDHSGTKKFNELI